MKKILVVFLFLVYGVIFSQETNSIYQESKEIVLAYFKKETIGGKLDFAKNMKDDKSPFYLLEKTLYNRKDFSVLLWAQAIKKTGKFQKKEAMFLWEQIKNRNLTKSEKKAFTKGYKMSLD